MSDSFPEKMWVFFFREGRVTDGVEGHHYNLFFWEGGGGGGGVMVFSGSGFSRPLFLKMCV